jgi:hypothetical protein
MPEHEAAPAVEQLVLGTQHKLVTRALSPAQHSTAQHSTTQDSQHKLYMHLACHALPCLIYHKQVHAGLCCRITTGAPATNRQPAAAGLTLVCWGYCLLSVGGRPG